MLPGTKEIYIEWAFTCVASIARKFTGPEEMETATLQLARCSRDVNATATAE